MFEKSAEYYDAFYRAIGKDYAVESQRVIDLIKEKMPDARTLLDVGCGTGGHVEYFRRDFACKGIDLDDGMLDIARSRFEGIPFLNGNMIEFRLDECFDAVVCLFSAIGYVATKENLFETAKNFARHVNPGGVVIVEPWITPDAWHSDGSAQIIAIDEPEVQAVRMGHSRRIEDITEVEMHYLLNTPDGIEHRTEIHKLGLFSFADYAAAFMDAGLDVHVDHEGLTGRGLIIATAN